MQEVVSLVDLAKKLAKGKISQDDYNAITTQQGSDDRFNNVGISKAINNGNYAKAAERANAATDAYTQASGYGDSGKDLMDSLQATYNTDRNSKNVGSMVDAYATAHPTGANADSSTPATDPAAEANSDVPDNVNQDITQGIADTGKDVLSKVNGYLDQGQDYGNMAEQEKGYGYDPSTAPGADAYNNQVNNDLQQNLGYVDDMYNTDYDHPGTEGAKFLKTSLQGGENLYNSGMQDSDTASGFYSDLGNDYANAKLTQYNTAFNNATQRKDTERTGVRNAAQNYSGQAVNQQNNANNMGSNLLNQGLGALTGAGNQNLANLGFEQNALENNYTNEQNARLTFFNLLQNKQFMDKYGDDFMKSLSQGGGSSGGGFPWSSVIQGVGSAAAMLA